MLKTMGQIWPIVKSIVPDRKLISCWLTLLALHILGILILYDVIPEFDLVNHFLFGFLISESVSKGAHSVGLHKVLTKKLHKHEWFRKSVRRVDFLIRFSGFFLIGALLWESAEFLIGPLIGYPADPFFTLPINMHNIDGAMDVTIGSIGTALAWHKDKNMRAHKN
jgi:hypothetical protein